MPPKTYMLKTTYQTEALSAMVNVSVPCQVTTTSTPIYLLGGVQSINRKTDSLLCALFVILRHIFPQIQQNASQMAAGFSSSSGETRVRGGLDNSEGGARSKVHQTHHWGASRWIRRGVRSSTSGKYTRQSRGAVISRLIPTNVMQCATNASDNFEPTQSLNIINKSVVLARCCGLPDPV